MKETYEPNRTFEETYSRYPFAPIVRFAVRCARLLLVIRRSRRGGTWRKAAAIDPPTPGSDMRVAP